MVSQSIAILGASGFIGSNLTEFYPNCTKITIDNYPLYLKDHFGTFINANGNSKKNLPNTNPIADFDLTVRNTLKSIIDFKFDTYVYLSSCEVYGDLSLNYNTREGIEINPSNISRYALSKYLAECIVRKYCKKWIIIRLNGIIGPQMTKGPIFDIINGDKLWVSSESQFQLLHVKYIATFVAELLNRDIVNETFNLTGINSIHLNQVIEMTDKKIESPQDPIIIHDINLNKSNGIMRLPNSLDNLKEIL